MRRGILLIMLAVFLLVLLCGLQAESRALSGHMLVIDRGPITFSSSNKKQSIDFEVPAEYLDGCEQVMLFVGVRKSVPSGAFMCRFYINGRSIGGGGNSGTGTNWNISGMPAWQEEIHAGNNQIVLAAEEYGGRETTIYDGQAGGVVLYFKKDKNEDEGLLDYINYGEPPAPEGDGLIKEFCWVTGIIHEHSTTSDGSYSVEARAKQAKELGYDFIILADHFVQIDKPIKAPGTYYKDATEIAKSKLGFANYVKSCRDLTSDGHFVAVAGAEFNTPWHQDDKTACFAHTMCLGSIQKTDALTNTQGKEGKQAELITAINSIGLSVAAHPNLVSSKSASIRPWEDIRFKYDTTSPEKYAGLDGVEIGNADSAEQDEADMAFYMKLMKAHHPAFPTGGCDSHGWGDKEDGERMKRITGVYVEELSENGLLKAIKQGNVYASIEGVRITECDPAPSFFQQYIDRAAFSFTLGGLPSKVIGQMYRNGEPIAESKQVLSPESPIYNWTDKNCPKTETWYNFRVLPNYLITAPIKICIGD